MLSLPCQFEYQWQEDQFKEWLLDCVYNTYKITQPATDENCRKSSIFGALLNLFFLHNRGIDVNFFFAGDKYIRSAWVETLDDEYYVDKKEYPTLVTVYIPKNATAENILLTFFNNQLVEEKRNALISQSRNAGLYKDQSRGKNRFDRKRYSKIANTVKQYNTINMNDLFKKDILQVEIPVTGETDTYTVTIKLEGVIAEIQKNVKNNNNKFEFRTVVQAITKVFNTSNVFVKCTCPDFKYTYAHHLILNNISVDDSSQDPGPGKGIRNPNDDKGRGCKHLLLTLANADWVMKVSSVVSNYVNYAAEKLQKPFLKLIFPKIYGVDADSAVEEGIVESEEDLKSTAGLIDKINKWARTRGLKQNKGKPAPEPEDEEDSEN